MSGHIFGVMVGMEEGFLCRWKYSVISVMTVFSCNNRKTPDNSSCSSFVQI